jgi:hypothetical protein
VAGATLPASFGPPHLARVSHFNNPIADALFSPQGGGAYFGAANTAVQYTTAATIGAYAAGLSLPTLIGGGGIAQVAIGTNEAGGIHFAVGVDGAWMHGTPLIFLDGIEMQSFRAADFAASAFKLSIPVLNPGAVLPEAGELVTNCFTGVCSAVLRGWIP